MIPDLRSCPAKDVSFVSLFSLSLTLVACSQPIELDWKASLGAASVSTPLVTPAFVAAGHERGLSILEPSGAVRCTFDAQGEIIGKPATDGNLVYVGSTNYLFYAVDLGCKQVWRFATRDRIKSDPLVAEGRVFFSSYDGHVYALNAGSGEVAWVFPQPPEAKLEEVAREAQAEPEPAAPVAAPAKKAKAKAKKKPGSAPAPAASPAKPTDTATAKAAKPADPAGAKAVKSADGAVAKAAKPTEAAPGTKAAKAKPAKPAKAADPDKAAEAAAPAVAEGAAPAPAPRAAEPLEVGDFSYSSLVLADGVLYVGNLDGNLYALRAQDGALLWRFLTEGSVTSTPTIDSDSIYFGSNDNNVYALELPKSGSTEPRLRWKYSTRDWVNSSPRIAEGVLYVGSNDRHLYALDAATGEFKWRYEAKGPVISIPAIYKNLVFFAGASGDGAIYALDRSQGTLFWRGETGGKIESDPVLVSDKIYVTSADQMLYAYSIRATTEK